MFGNEPPRETFCSSKTSQPSASCSRRRWCGPATRCTRHGTARKRSKCSISTAAGRPPADRHAHALHGRRRAGVSAAHAPRHPEAVVYLGLCRWQRARVLWNFSPSRSRASSCSPRSGRSSTVHERAPSPRARREVTRQPIRRLPQGLRLRRARRHRGDCAPFPRSSRLPRGHIGELGRSPRRCRRPQRRSAAALCSVRRPEVVDAVAG